MTSTTSCASSWQAPYKLPDGAGGTIDIQPPHAVLESQFAHRNVVLPSIREARQVTDRVRVLMDKFRKAINSDALPAGFDAANAKKMSGIWLRWKADQSMSLWRNAALLRAGWPLRVLPDEAARIMASGFSEMFTELPHYIAAVIRGDTKGVLADDITAWVNQRGGYGTGGFARGPGKGGQANVPRDIDPQVSMRGKNWKKEKVYNPDGSYRIEGLDGIRDNLIVIHNSTLAKVVTEHGVDDAMEILWPRNGEPSEVLKNIAREAGDGHQLQNVATARNVLRHALQNAEAEVARFSGGKWYYRATNNDGSVIPGQWLDAYGKPVELYNGIDPATGRPWTNKTIGAKLTELDVPGRSKARTLPARKRLLLEHEGVPPELLDMPDDQSVFTTNRGSPRVHRLITHGVDDGDLLDPAPLVRFTRPSRMAGSTHTYEALGAEGYAFHGVASANAEAELGQGGLTLDFNRARSYAGETGVILVYPIEDLPPELRVLLENGTDVERYIGPGHDWVPIDEYVARQMGDQGPTVDDLLSGRDPNARVTLQDRKATLEAQLEGRPLDEFTPFDEEVAIQGLQEELDEINDLIRAGETYVPEVVDPARLAAEAEADELLSHNVRGWLDGEEYVDDIDPVISSATPRHMTSISVDEYDEVIRRGSLFEELELLDEAELGTEAALGSPRIVIEESMDQRKLEAMSQRLPSMFDPEEYPMPPTAPRAQIGADPNTFGTEFVNRMFYGLGAVPTQKLLRHPFFETRWLDELSRLYLWVDADGQAAIRQMADANKLGRRLDNYINKQLRNRGLKSIPDSPKRLAMSAEEIDELARFTALEHVRELLYDLTKSNNFWDSMRLVTPFGEAWWEVISRWGKLYNPFDPFNWGRLLAVKDGSKRTNSVTRCSTCRCRGVVGSRVALASRPNCHPNRCCSSTRAIHGQRWGRLLARCSRSREVWQIRICRMEYATLCGVSSTESSHHPTLRRWARLSVLWCRPHIDGCSNGSLLESSAPKWRTRLLRYSMLFATRRTANTTATRHKARSEPMNWLDVLVAIQHGGG
jgi:hypothetical protein